MVKEDMQIVGVKADAEDRESLDHILWNTKENGPLPCHFHKSNSNSLQQTDTDAPRSFKITRHVSETQPDNLLQCPAGPPCQHHLVQSVLLFRIIIIIIIILLYIALKCEL